MRTRARWGFYVNLKGVSGFREVGGSELTRFHWESSGSERGPIGLTFILQTLCGLFQLYCIKVAKFSG